MNFKVEYEDNHLIIVNKRAGLLTQGDQTQDVSLLEEVKAYIKEKYKKPGQVYLGLVHRLDRPTSGVLVFALSLAMASVSVIYLSIDRVSSATDTQASQIIGADLVIS